MVPFSLCIRVRRLILGGDERERSLYLRLVVAQQVGDFRTEFLNLLGRCRPPDGVEHVVLVLTQLQSPLSTFSLSVSNSSS